MQCVCHLGYKPPSKHHFCGPWGSASTGQCWHPRSSRCGPMRKRPPSCCLDYKPLSEQNLCDLRESSDISQSEHPKFSQTGHHCRKQSAYHRGCKLPTKHHLCGLQVFSGISQWWHSKFSPNNPQNLKPTQHRPVTNGRNPLASLPKSNLEIRSLLVRPRRRPPRQRGSSWPVGFWSYFEMGDELGCMRTRCKIKK